jgi:hypothetical protein
MSPKAKSEHAVSIDFAPTLRTLNNARKTAVYEGEEPDLGDQSLEELAADVESAVDEARPRVARATSLGNQRVVIQASGVAPTALGSPSGSSR